MTLLLKWPRRLVALEPEFKPILARIDKLNDKFWGLCTAGSIFFLKGR